MNEENLSIETINPKPNCSNTLKRLYNEEEELVQKLNFFTLGERPTKSLSLYKKKHPSVETESNGPTMLKGILPNVRSSEHPILESKYKYICRNRAENQSYEIQLEKKRKVCDEKVKELKLEKEKIIKMISSIQKEIEDMIVTIDFLSNFEKFFDMQDRMKRSLELMQYESFLGGADYKDKKKKMEEEWERMNKVRSSLVKNNFQRETEVNDKKMELATKIKIKEELNTKLDEIRNKIKAIQNENKEIKNELLLHYHNLLNEGKDTRKEGLMWIIKAIWDIGHDILVSYIPKFLDDKAIAFIFQYALKDIELQRIKNQIEEIKTKMKALRSKGKTFQTDLDITVISNKEERSNTQPKNNRFKNLYDKQSEEKSSGKTISLKKFKELISSKTRLDEDIIVSLKFINMLEKQADKIKKEINQMKNNELERISKEFLMNDYERRFSITLDQVISAIIGEDQTATEFAHQNRLQKAFYQSVKKCMTFNFLESIKIPTKNKTKIQLFNTNINSDGLVD